MKTYKSENGNRVAYLPSQVVGIYTSVNMITVVLRPYTLIMLSCKDEGDLNNVYDKMIGDLEK